MTTVSTKFINNSSNIQIGYDVLSQETNNNRTLIRAYLVLNVGGNYVSWNRGEATIQGKTVAIGTHYSRGSYTLVSNEIWVNHDGQGNFTGTLSGSLWTTWLSGNASGVFTLPKINRQALITKCDDVTDEQIPYMEISNPANYVLNLRLEFEGYIISRNSIRANGKYEFILTEEEKDLIYEHNKEKSSCKVRYTAATTYDGVTEVGWSFFDKTYHIIEKKPSFGDENTKYEDINPRILEITQNNQFIIEGYSKVRYQIIKPMKVHKKGYPKEYKIYLNNNYIKTIPYTEDVITYEFDTIIRNDEFSNKIGAYAIDSRGWFEGIFWPITKKVKYSKPNIFLSAKRLNNFENETTIKITGDFSNFEVKENHLSQIPNLKQNSVKSVKFRYREIGGEFSKWSNLTFVTEGNKINCTDKKLNLDKEKSFEIEAKLEDELEEVIATSIVDVGVPSFFVATNKKAISVNCLPPNDAKNGEIYFKGQYGSVKRVLNYVKDKGQVQFKDREENLYPKIKREIIMAFLSGREQLNHPTPYYFTKINLDSEKSTTSKLILTDGKVKIGKGVSKVLVSMMVNIWRNSGNGDSQADLRQAGIKHKNLKYFSALYGAGINLGQTVHVISNLLLETEENDEIEIFDNIGPVVGTSTILGDNGTGTYLTVEIIE